jgi:hypothetical protein
MKVERKKNKELLQSDDTFCEFFFFFEFGNHKVVSYDFKIAFQYQLSCHPYCDNDLITVRRYFSNYIISLISKYEDRFKSLTCETVWTKQE